MIISHQNDNKSERILSDSPLVFVVERKNLEKRIDVKYYEPKYRHTYEKLGQSQFELVTLEEISKKIFSGITPLSGGPDYVTEEGGIPFVRSGNITEDDEINFEEMKHIKREVHDKRMKSSQLRKNDLLIAIVGATIGQVGLYKYNIEANINQAIAGVRLKKHVKPEYVKWFLLTELGQTQLDRLKRPVARANINLREIGSIEVPIPPRVIQNNIVVLMDKVLKKKKKMDQEAERVLASIDDYILSELSITLLEFNELNSSTYALAVDSFKNNRWNVGYWKPEYLLFDESVRKGKYSIVQFGELIEKIVNGIDCRLFTEKGTKYLRVGNIKKFEIDETGIKQVSMSLDDVKKDVNLEKGDILLTRKGTFGIATSIEENMESLISSEIFKIKLKQSKKINPFYIVTVLNSSIGKKQFSRNSVGSIMGSLSQRAVKLVSIPFPPKSTQNKIASEVRKRLQRAKQLKENAEKTLEKAKRWVENTILGEENGLYNADR